MVRVISKIVQAAIAKIREHWHDREVYEKFRADGSLEVFTTADIEAQKVYVHMLQEAFPGVGIIAEEEKLRVACTLTGIDAYFTVDSLDGSRAFERGQSSGVGTQIALVINGEVVCVFTGDVNNGNLYWYGPGDKAIYMHSFGKTINLLQDSEVQRRRAKPLIKQVVLLSKSTEHLQDTLWPSIVKPAQFGGRFLDYHVGGGSIALRVVRLLRADIGALFVKAYAHTPWDSTPIIGMAKQFKIAWLRPTADATQLERFVPQLPLEVSQIEHDILLMPEEKVPELLAPC